MGQEFQYDVFLSHSAKDKAVVRPLAERLRQEGLKAPILFGIRSSEVGFAQPGMSAQAFGSDWAQLDAGTFRFRDPLNRELHCLALQPFLDGSLAQHPLH
jgi:hypothetical protein